MKIDKIYVMMYDKRIDNWEYIQDCCNIYLKKEPELHLSGDGVSVKNYKYNLIDSTELPPQLPYSTNYPSWWTSRTYNAYKSHISLLKRACDAKKTETLLILEDDVIFNEDIELWDIWENKISVFLDKINWDMVYLGGYPNQQSMFKMTDNLYKIENGCGGLHAFLCKPHRILQRILDIGPIGPVDETLGRYIQPLCYAYLVCPMLINQRSGYSYIEQSNLKKPTYQIRNGILSKEE